MDGALSIKPAQLTHGSGNYTTERVLSMQISGDIGLGKCRLPMEKRDPWIDLGSTGMSKSDVFNLPSKAGSQHFAGQT